MLAVVVITVLLLLLLFATAAPNCCYIFDVAVDVNDSSSTDAQKSE